MFQLLGFRADSPLVIALTPMTRPLGIVALLSVMLNVLTLSGSIFMMMVYDMVLPSGSLPTLAGLFLLVLIVYCFQGYFDLTRSRILASIGSGLDLALSGQVTDAIARHALHNKKVGDGLQPMRDLDQIRSFLSGAGPTALIDLPWLVFFVAILFLMHPWLGMASLVGAIVLALLTFVSERMSARRVGDLSMAVSMRNAAAETNRRHAEAIHVLGMQGSQRLRWFRVNQTAIDAQQRLSGIVGTLGTTSKMFRILLQSAVLAVGAWIVIRGEATGGIIFASAILSSRALAPVEQAIANWRGFVGARQGWSRLDEFLRRFPPRTQAMTQLPRPTQSFVVEQLSLLPPGSTAPTVKRVSFGIGAGDAVGIIGPSGSGKTSLVRGLLGVWPPAEGKVMLDGAALIQWDPQALGRHMGYVPQSVELLDGTIAQNIARFDPEATSELVIAASKAAHAHDLIVALPKGYETPVDSEGASLSAGQRQRIALACAMYRDPFLIVLDEPNSNLDSDGEAALSLCIRGARQRGAAIVIVAHRASILEEVNLVLAMRDGMAIGFGPRDEILSKVFPQRPRQDGVPPPPPTPPTGVVSSQIFRPRRK